MEEVNHDRQFDPIELSDESAGTEVLDPLSPEYAPGLSLVVLMRIYEVQLAILREANPEVAERLLNLHAEGRISTPMPYVDANQWD